MSFDKLRTRASVLSLALLLAPTLAFAAPRPFAVGGYEGGGAPSGVAGWLLAEQSALTRAMAAHIHALAGDSSAFWGLVGLGLAYGVFHAAGPGHGKAVIASYMMANDRAARRGVALAFLAALLQGAVAIALVGVAALLFDATAARMTLVADWLSRASFAGVALIGAWLSWRKSFALVRAIREFFARRAEIASAALFAGAAWRPAPLALPRGFRAETPGAEALSADACGHGPDPSGLEGEFSWRSAMAAVAAAGARPCSGSILVLVFALAQGAFLSGVAATLAISLGTAVTTGALALLALGAKDWSLRLAAGENTRVALIARVFEFVAALAVLAFGLALWTAAGMAGA